MGVCTVSLILAILQIPPLSDLLMFDHPRVIDRMRAESLAYREHLEDRIRHTPQFRQWPLWRELIRQEDIYGILNKLSDAQMHGHRFLGKEHHSIFGFRLIDDYQAYEIMQSRHHLLELRDWLGPALYYSGWIPRPCSPLPTAFPAMPSAAP